MYERLPAIPNAPAFFGRQLLMNARDEVVGQEERLLLSAISAGLEEVACAARAMGGLAVPAHINRGANGILTNLGFIPSARALRRWRYPAVRLRRRSTSRDTWFCVHLMHTD